MNPKERGIILLVTAVILSLVATLMLYMEHLMSKYTHTHELMRVHHQEKKSLEHKALSLLKRSAFPISCTHDGVGESCVDGVYRYWVRRLGSHRELFIYSINQPNQMLVLRDSLEEGLISYRVLVI